MSTRSSVIIKQDDNTYKGIYCHHDGYLEGVGIDLYINYNTKEKLLHLINEGDMSSVGDHYHDNDSPYTSKDLNIDIFKQAYNYLFEDGEWFVKYYSVNKYVSLETELLNQDETNDIVHKILARRRDKKIETVINKK